MHIEKICKRLRIQRVVLAGDRGMITSKRIDEELRATEGLEWVTALRSDLPGAGGQHRETGFSERESAFVAPRSAAARRNEAFKRTEDDDAVQSFREGLDDLGAVAKNQGRRRQTEAEFEEITQAKSLQQRAFGLLGVARL